MLKVLFFSLLGSVAINATFILLRVISAAKSARAGSGVRFLHISSFRILVSLFVVAILVAVVFVTFKWLYSWILE
jgi:hypothetical protein